MTTKRPQATEVFRQFAWHLAEKLVRTKPISVRGGKR
jgi:hypothetical protein